MKSYKTEIYILDVVRLSAIYGKQLKYGKIENDCILNLDNEICYRNGERARVLEINGSDYILESDGRFILTKDELLASKIKNLENNMKRTMEHDLIAQGYTQDEVKRILASRKAQKPIQNKRLIKNGTANYWQDMDEFPIVIFEPNVSEEQIREMRDANGYDDSVSDEKIAQLIEEDEYTFASNDADDVIYGYDFETIKAEIKDGYYFGLQLIFSELDDYSYDIDDDTAYDVDENGNEITLAEHTKTAREEDIQKGNELINKLCSMGWQKLGVVGRFSNGEAVYTRLDNTRKPNVKKPIKSELEEPTDEVEHMNTRADREWAEQRKLANSRKAENKTRK